MFSKINATVLIVKDLEAARVFYGDTLGLGIAFEDDVSTAYTMEGDDFLILQESAAIEMISAEAISLEGGHRVLLCAEVADVDATYQALEAKGVNCLKAPKSQHWGRRTAYFADPEGNLWEIYHHLPDAE